MDTPKRLHILCLDFDGVCHSYTSGWRGAAVIPDPPVPGMWEFLESAVHHFELHIFSSRSHQFGGTAAMKAWFLEHANSGFRQDIARKFLRFPLEKPPSFVTIDDRCICFTGTWPSMKDVLNFRVWNK